MLRDLSKLSARGYGIMGTNKVGVLGSALTSGFALPGLLENDKLVGDPAGTLYRMDMNVWPSAGVLTITENGAFSFVDAPDGTYTGQMTVYKDNVPDTGTYVFQVGDTLPVPSGIVTLQPAVDGQSQRFVIATTNATSGMYTLTGANSTIGPTPFTITSNTADFTVTGLPGGDTYVPSMTVTGDGGTIGVTGASNVTVMGIAGGGEPAPVDVAAPDMVSTITSSSITQTGFTFAWQAATDVRGVVGYQYRVNGGAYTDVGTSLSQALSGLSAGISYSIDVRAYDEAGNMSAPLSVVIPTISAITPLKAQVLINGVMTTIPAHLVGTGLKPVVYHNGRLKQRAASEGTPIVFVDGRYRLLPESGAIEI